MVTPQSIHWSIERQANWPHQLGAADGNLPAFGAYKLNPNRVEIHNALFCEVIGVLAQSLLMT